jgi:hypothetical protein
VEPAHAKRLPGPKWDGSDGRPRGQERRWGRALGPDRLEAGGSLRPKPR